MSEPGIEGSEARGEAPEAALQIELPQDFMRQLDHLSRHVSALSKQPKGDTRRGWETSEARVATVGGIIGTLIAVASLFVPEHMRETLVQLGMLLGASAPTYIVSRGLAKGGRSLGQVMLLALLAGGTLMGTSACRGPGSDSDYIRRDQVDGTIVICLDRHDQWGARLHELGEITADDLRSAVMTSAVARHVLTVSDPGTPIAVPVTSDAVEGPQSLPGPEEARAALPDPYADVVESTPERLPVTASGGTLRR